MGEPDGDARADGAHAPLGHDGGQNVARAEGQWDVCCTGYSEVGGHTVYIMETSPPSRAPVCQKQHRFNDFRELHAALLPSLAPNLPAAFPVAKSVFGGESVKKERVLKLQEYVRMAVKLAASTQPDGVQLPAVLLDFLGVGGSSEANTVQSLAAGGLASACSTHPTPAAAAADATAFGVPTDEELAAGVITEPVVEAPLPAPAPAKQSKQPPPPQSKATAVDTFSTAAMHAAVTGSGSQLSSHFQQLATSRPDDVNEALREAIKSGDSSECLELLHSMADPNYRDRQGNFPLHMACMFGRSDVVGALLCAGADQTKENAAGELPSRMAPVSIRMKMEEFKQTGKYS